MAYGFQIVVDSAHPHTRAGWWTETLGWEAKPVKNRLRLDVRADGQDKAQSRARLESRGTTFLRQAGQGPCSWYARADPEGNESCIT